MQTWIILYILLIKTRRTHVGSANLFTVLIVCLNFILVLLALFIRVVHALIAVLPVLA